MSAEEAQRCSFVNKKKRNKSCTRPVLNNRNFCEAHAMLEARPGEQLIPCPLDPRHSVASCRLRGHLRKCNMQKYLTNLSSTCGFVRDINTYNHDSSIKPSCTVSSEPSQLLPRVEALFRDPQSGYFSQMLNWSTRFLKGSCLSFCPEPQPCIALSGKTKHKEQHAAFVNFLARMKPCHVIIEMGAGKGGLSLSLAEHAGPGTMFVLLDNSNFHNKRDRYIRRMGVAVHVRRMRIDIKDVDLLPLLLGIIAAQQQSLSAANETLISSSQLSAHLRVLIVGKHLCGVATDYALRCITKFQAAVTKLSATHANHAGPTFELAGAMISLCCHHKGVTWHKYAHPQFFEQLGFTYEEFERVCALSSCANGHRAQHKSLRTSKNPESSRKCFLDGMQPERGQLLTFGLMCKRLLDIGRCIWVEENSDSLLASLMRCSDTTTENVALTLEQPPSSAYSEQQ